MSTQQPKSGPNDGFSLIELLIAVAISGIAALAIATTYNNYISQKFAIESKGIAVSDIDTASKFIRSTFPSLINNTTGLNGQTPLPTGWWNCAPFANCALSAFTTTDNSSITASPKQQIMSAQCVQITNTALAASTIHTLAVDETKPANCVQCSQGYLPVLTLTVLNSTTVDVAPTVSKNISFPPITNNLGPGTLATGVCFNADGYDYNKSKTAATPDIIKLYNRWTVTLIAIYLNAPLPANASATTANNLLRKVTERIMVSPPQQLGPEINYLPMR